MSWDLFWLSTETLGGTEERFVLFSDGVLQNCQVLYQHVLKNVTSTVGVIENEPQLDTGRRLSTNFKRW